MFLINLWYVLHKWYVKFHGLYGFPVHPDIPDIISGWQDFRGIFESDLQHPDHKVLWRATREDPGNYVQRQAAEAVRRR